jgi:hypothetical protein
MLLNIINYAVRGLIVLIGILLFFGVLTPDYRGDALPLKVVGVVFVLFGVYRIVMYYTAQQRYLNNDTDDE